MNAPRITSAAGDRRDGIVGRIEPAQRIDPVGAWRSWTDRKPKTS